MRWSRATDRLLSTSNGTELTTLMLLQVKETNNTRLWLQNINGFKHSHDQVHTSMLLETLHDNKVNIANLVRANTRVKTL
eukprot:8256702-Ditylum_brightwellii.AAC.1